MAKGVEKLLGDARMAANVGALGVSAARPMPGSLAPTRLLAGQLSDLALALQTPAMGATATVQVARAGRAGREMANVKACPHPRWAVKGKVKAKDKDKDKVKVKVKDRGEVETGGDPMAVCQMTAVTAATVLTGRPPKPSQIP